MTKKIFIAGTGVGVGKTYISTLIIKKMLEQGYNCGYYKPVNSGVVELSGYLIDSDANYVVKFANLNENPAECLTYYWKESGLPHYLSKIKGEIIDVERIKSDFSTLSNKYDYLLIEGTGGLTCPLILEKNEKYLLKDLIWELGLSIIIVADSEEKDINSILMTFEYAKINGIEIEGIILNNYDANDPIHWDNIQQIEKLTGLNVVATVPKNGNNIILLEGLFRE